MSKKALLVISFGTSYRETREKTIGAIEKDLQMNFPDHDFKRAFTSRMIIKKLKERDGEAVDIPREALEKLKNEGYTEVVCQTTHVINGYEYDLTISELKKFENDFEVLTIGAPLLTTIKDYERVVDIVAEELPKTAKGEALLYMGHGSEHHANATYPAMDYTFKHMGHPNMFMGTVEGFPSLDDIIPQLKEKGYHKLYLAPFMIVAGDHAINDMASDEADSWKTLLTNEGFEVECVLKGLGQFRGIQDMFAEHAKDGKDVKTLL
ncbi:MAG: sirohydrochlorin cobaltochelatase [Eubacterium sp.]